jgi:protease IV
MNFSPLRLLRRVVVGAWTALDFTRRALLNLIVLLLLAAVAWALLRPGPPPIAEKTTLVLNLQGPVREQFSGSSRDHLLRQARGQKVSQTRLRDVLTALEAAAKDPAIVRVLLLTDDFAGAGPATQRELAAALQRVRAAGKPVWAWGMGYSQAAYYIAAHADRVWMHPMGGVRIEGYGGHRTYFREAFDRFGISPHVLRAGAYKNAGETWVASGPSPETLESEGFLLDALWASYTGGVESARKLPAGTLASLVEALPQKLAAARGDGAALAVAEKLVDGLKTRDEMQAMLIEAGAGEDDGKRLRSVGFGEYLARIRHGQREAVIGVVVAEGGIRDGDAPPGAIGGDSTSALIKRARDDKRIKALVLRVDSPGGSAVASEQVRRELELTRAAGKPVVVSMGDLAASGGYWIGMAADEVIADPTTVTGSIGVVTMFPGFHEAFGRLGLRSGGYSTTWLAGAADPRRPLDPRLAQVIQSGIDRIYSRFTETAAAARKKTPAQIDAVAQGRVWTGAQALERGLIDRNGSFGDAIHAAAQRAKLADGQWQLGYVEVEPGRFDRLFLMLASQFGGLADLGAWLPAADEAADWLALARALLPGGLDGDLAALLRLAAEAPPGAPLAHCLCEAP